MSGRIEALLARADEALADEIRQIDEGTVVSAPSLPHVWGLNLVELKREDLDAAQAAAVADREQSSLSHRALSVYGETIGPRLAPGLRGRGYDAQRVLMMEHRGGPPVAAGEAAELSLERAAPMLAAFRRTRPYADRPGAVSYTHLTLPTTPYV